MSIGAGEDGQFASGVRAYFAFSTFFVPKPPGDTTTKDGSPLAYNDACTVGGLGQQLPEVQGVWRNYVMCSSSHDQPDTATCGNPWGPTDECLAKSCVDCHAATDVPKPEMPGFWAFHMGWLPTLNNSKISQCYDAIALANTQGTELFKELAPSSCVP